MENSSPVRRQLTAITIINQTEFWPYHLEGCKNTAELFLEAKSSRKVKYEEDRQAECRLIEGKWEDYFTEEKFTNAKNARVTTVIPFSLALEAGAKNWSFQRLHAFAHDKELFLITKKDNKILQSLSDPKFFKQFFSPDLNKLQEDSPSWSVSDVKLPKTKYCEFVGRWKLAKDRWGLEFSTSEKVLNENYGQFTQACFNSTYDRKRFPHWKRLQGQICDSRTLALIRDSEKKTKNKWEVWQRDFPEALKGQTAEEIDKKINDPCATVVEGKWWDPYTNQTFERVVDYEWAPDKERLKRVNQQLDVDHLVPLGNAYKTGALQWNEEKRERYANYLVDRHHLLTVDSTENQSKGMRDPSEYMPPNRQESYHCEYIKNWIAIKWRWALGLTPQEKHALTQEIKKCPNSLQKELNFALTLLQIETGRR